MTTSQTVLFPLAQDAEGRTVEATKAPPHQRYHCLECDNRMVVRQGDQKTWHFAHYEPHPECTPDLVLHKQTQKTFQASVQKMLDGKAIRKLLIHFPCSNCNGEFDKMAYTSPRVPKSTHVVLEDREVAPPSIVDAAVYSKGKLWFVIEFINTHEPEQETRRRLQELTCPVYLVKTSYEGLALERNQLLNGRRPDPEDKSGTYLPLYIKAYEVLNAERIEKVDPRALLCSGCLTNPSEGRRKRRQAEWRAEQRTANQGIICPGCRGPKSNGAWRCKNCSNSPWWCACGKKKSPNYDKCRDCAR